MKVSSEQLKIIQEKHNKAVERKQFLSRALHLLEPAQKRLWKEWEENSLQIHMYQLVLKESGVEVPDLDSEDGVVREDEIKDLLDRLSALLVPKKKVVGSALLDLIAQEMVRRDASMNFTEMLDWLDEHGYERPGENARNNLIGMVSRCPERFARVERGRYSVTEEEWDRQRSAQMGEGVIDEQVESA